MSTSIVRAAESLRPSDYGVHLIQLVTLGIVTHNVPWSDEFMPSVLIMISMLFLAHGVLFIQTVYSSIVHRNRSLVLKNANEALHVVVFGHVKEVEGLCVAMRTDEFSRCSAAEINPSAFLTLLTMAITIGLLAISKQPSLRITIAVPTVIACANLPAVCIAKFINTLLANQYVFTGECINRVLFFRLGCIPILENETRVDCHTVIVRFDQDYVDLGFSKSERKRSRLTLSDTAGKVTFAAAIIKGACLWHGCSAKCLTPVTDGNELNGIAKRAGGMLSRYSA